MSSVVYWNKTMQKDMDYQTHQWSSDISIFHSVIWKCHSWQHLLSSFVIFYMLIFHDFYIAFYLLYIFPEALGKGHN